jgi:hypothetical protein
MQPDQAEMPGHKSDLQEVKLMRTKILIQRIAGLVSAATAIAAFSTPSLAYNIYEKDSTELNVDIEAVLGVFYSEESYNLGAKTEAGDAKWQEGYIKYGLSGSQAMGAGSGFYLG